jgi:hypothetical protein
MADRQSILKDQRGSALDWTYLDEAATYRITPTITAAVDETPGRQTYSGWLKATPSYATSSLVTGSSGKLPLMELRVCVGLSFSGDTCGDISGNNGGNPTSFYSINRLTNLPLP